MSVVLILSLCVLVTLLLGLPLLLKPDSLILDIVGFSILTGFVLFYVLSMGDWWLLLPILALLALVAWLDRRGRESRPADEAGMSTGTRTQFRLWRTAHYVQQALLFFVLVSFVTGFGIAALRYITSCLLIGLVASVLFRFGFVRSARRDSRPPALPHP